MSERISFLVFWMPKYWKDKFIAFEWKIVCFVVSLIFAAKYILDDSTRIS